MSSRPPAHENILHELGHVQAVASKDSGAPNARMRRDSCAVLGFQHMTKRLQVHFKIEFVTRVWDNEKS